jgi:hypothetical protein
MGQLRLLPIIMLIIAVWATYLSRAHPRSLAESWVPQLLGPAGRTCPVPSLGSV